MDFWRLYLRYATWRDTYNIIKDIIIKRDYGINRIKVEYLMLTFVRMSYQILESKWWADDIRKRVSGIGYIYEFVGYLDEIKVGGNYIFKGESKDRFDEFCRIYGECYRKFCEEIGK